MTDDPQRPYRFALWFFVHNAIAHPLLCLGRPQWAEAFHDWTAEKMSNYP